MYDESTLQTDLVINLDVVAKWLGVRKDNLLQTLRESYKESFDYTAIKAKNPNAKDNRNNNYKLVMITPDTFKRLCMRSRSKKSEQVRTYFIQMESLLIKYREDILRGMETRINDLERNQQPKSHPKQGFIYVIKASKSLDSVYKGSV